MSETSFTAEVLAELRGDQGGPLPSRASELLDRDAVALIVGVSTATVDRMRSAMNCQKPVTLAGRACAALTVDGSRTVPGPRRIIPADLWPCGRRIGNSKTRALAGPLREGMLNVSVFRRVVYRPDP